MTTSPSPSPRTRPSRVVQPGDYVRDFESTCSGWASHVGSAHVIYTDDDGEEHAAQLEDVEVCYEASRDRPSRDELGIPQRFVESPQDAADAGGDPDTPGNGEAPQTPRSDGRGLVCLVRPGCRAHLHVEGNSYAGPILSVSAHGCVIEDENDQGRRGAAWGDVMFDADDIVCETTEGAPIGAAVSDDDSPIEERIRRHADSLTRIMAALVKMGDDGLIPQHEIDRTQRTVNQIDDARGHVMSLADHVRFREVAATA